MDNNVINKKDLNRVFLRSFFIRSCLNFERHQNLGFTNAISPVIDKLYSNNETERLNAYERHMQLFLTNPMMSGTVLGVSTAMEEKRANGTEITSEAISAVKTALMSPLARLGDSLLNGTVRPIFAGIAASLALEGSILGPIIFFIAMAILSIGIKYVGVFRGYKQGINFVTNIQESGIIDKITELASVAALTVIGGFIPGVVSLSTKIEYTSGETIINLQEQLDGLMPSILPLSYTLLMYILIKKTDLSAVSLIILTMLFGILGVYLGIF